ncbi:MFS transporter [Bradyrhizobium sp. CW9]|nr:MFS transporter [Bradyrhizobium sp. CW9]
MVELEYRVASENARAFHNVMQNVQLYRQRNGAYGWSIGRDIADPELWTERYHCPTWLDYLRQRNRWTRSERALDARPRLSISGLSPCVSVRMLERRLDRYAGRMMCPTAPRVSSSCGLEVRTGTSSRPFRAPHSKSPGRVDALALREPLAVASCLEDFHLQAVADTRHKKGATLMSGPSLRENVPAEPLGSGRSLFDRREGKPETLGDSLIG